ncbi:hypothetical protein BO99DRAFT_403211, partial [Aspergillus violaceofuscus CBS 115571]
MVFKPLPNGPCFLSSFACGRILLYTLVMHTPTFPHHDSVDIHQLWKQRIPPEEYDCMVCTRTQTYQPRPIL